MTVLPPGMDETAFALLLAASFAGSFVTVAFGIGGGAFLIAVMATMVPPQALIPVHGLVQLGSNAGRLTLLVRHVSWGALPWFAAGSVVGCAAGGVVVVDLPPAAVQTGVGLFVLWSVLARPPAWLRHRPAIAGLVSSFLTMFFGATGVFVANYVRSLDLTRHVHVATHAAAMTLQHALKVALFGLLGFAFADWGVFVAAMIASGLAGTLSGRLFLDRLNDAWFRRALDLVLVLISARLILGGLDLIPL